MRPQCVKGLHKHGHPDLFLLQLRLEPLVAELVRLLESGLDRRLHIPVSIALDPRIDKLQVSFSRDLLFKEAGLLAESEPGQSFAFQIEYIHHPGFIDPVDRLKSRREITAAGRGLHGLTQQDISRHLVFGSGDLAQQLVSQGSLFLGALGGKIGCVDLPDQAAGFFLLKGKRRQDLFSGLAAWAAGSARDALFP